MSFDTRATIYRHYRGGMYQLLAFRAVHHETGEEWVVYQALDGARPGVIFVRPAAEFHGESTPGVRRFTPCFTPAEVMK
jgi:hypothetical protein